MDGIEFCETIRRGGPKFQHVPIILVSSKWTDEDKVKAKKLGVIDCLEKPVKPERLIDIVKSELSQ